MPKTPKASDGETPKKRTRKSTAAAEDSTKVVKAAKTVTKTTQPRAAKAKPAAVPALEIVPPVVAAKLEAVHKEVVAMPSLEERIRIRAYELYLRRGGRNGSPEQDWLQATAEVYAESVA